MGPFVICGKNKPTRYKAHGRYKRKGYANFTSWVKRFCVVAIMSKFPYIVLAVTQFGLTEGPSPEHVLFTLNQLPCSSLCFVALF